MCDVMALEPREVFRYFKEISDIPRASKNNEAISDYLVEFAKAHGLEYYQDEAYNVIIYKDATPGYEDAEPVMIQGHMDMVAVKTEDSEHDFAKDPLELVIDGDWLTAKDTTLGADNGIAVAMALAALESDTMRHPALEVVITVDEEIGMLGAEVLDGTRLNARKIINIDSEEEGVITVGCAGAVDIDVAFPVTRESFKGVKYKYLVDGLQGGHSGNEIKFERGNAANITGRVLLEAMNKARFGLVSLAGGSATNVILSSVTGEIIVNAEDVEDFETSVRESLALLKTEYRTSDPGLDIALTRAEEAEDKAIDEESQLRILRYLEAAPAGVQNMSVELEGIPETSISMGVVNLESNAFRTRSMARSCVNSRKQDLCKKFEILVNALGGRCSFSGEYSAWEFRKGSDLLETSMDVFEKLFGRPAEVGAVHAGVECCKWAEKLGEIDAISIGPDMPDVHSVNERVSISSTARTWTFVKRILASCK